jgi:hypothetical protein
LRKNEGKKQISIFNKVEGLKVTERSAGGKKQLTSSSKNEEIFLPQ